MSLSKEDFDNLYRQYGPMVLRRCRFLLKDEEKALDAMQDVFIRLMERKDLLSEVCSSLFYTTATRVCLNKIRADNYRKGPEFDVIAATVEDNAATMQEEISNVSMLLNCIFQERDSRDKEIAILHYVDGYTLIETAEKMKMSVSGVRKRLANLKKHADFFKLGEEHE